MVNTVSLLVVACYLVLGVGVCSLARSDRMFVFLCSFLVFSCAHNARSIFYILYMKAVELLPFTHQRYDNMSWFVPGSFPCCDSPFLAIVVIIAYILYTVGLYKMVKIIFLWHNYFCIFFLHYISLYFRLCSRWFWKSRAWHLCIWESEEKVPLLLQL